MRSAIVIVAAVLVCASSAAAQTPGGDAVYRQHCAGCHEQSNPRIPPRDALQKMPAARIVRALDSGAMMAIAFTMSHDERQAVASYFGTSDQVQGPPASAFCTTATDPVVLG